MSGFFRNLGKRVGATMRKGKWLLRELTGTETEAIQAEYEAGRDMARAWADSLPKDRKPVDDELLRDVGGRLTSCVANANLRFTFRRYTAPEVNAFALPGGFVFVTASLLDLCQREEGEVAFILAHEMAHVICRHARDRMIGSSLLSVASVASVATPARGTVRKALHGLIEKFLQNAYAQDQEREADRLAVRLMEAAGFETQSAAKLLGRLAQLDSDPELLGGYFSSHPPLDERIAELTL